MMRFVRFNPVFVVLLIGVRGFRIADKSKQRREELDKARHRFQVQTIDGEKSCNSEAVDSCTVDLDGKSAEWWIDEIDSKRCTACATWKNTQGHTLSGSGFSPDWWQTLPAEVQWWKGLQPRDVLDKLKFCKSRNTQIGCETCDANNKCVKCKTGYEPLNGFCVSSDYSEKEAIQFGYLCKIGFCNDRPSVESWTCGVACEKSVTPVPEKIKSWVNPTTQQGVLAYRFESQELVTGVDRGCIVAFRGTLGDVQKKLNNQCGSKTFSDGDRKMKLHNGYATIWAAIRDEVDKNLRDLGCRDELIFLTGHSLGASIATIAAYALQVKMGFKVGKVYAFAGPRVGFKEFMTSFQSKFNNPGQPVYYRVTHYKDLVTRLPPRSVIGCAMGYTHQGVEIHYPELCTEDCKENSWKRCVGPEDKNCNAGWTLTSMEVHCPFMAKWLSGGFCCCGHGRNGKTQSCIGPSPTNTVCPLETDDKAGVQTPQENSTDVATMQVEPEVFEDAAANYAADIESDFNARRSEVTDDGDVEDDNEPEDEDEAEDSGTLTNIPSPTPLPTRLPAAAEDVGRSTKAGRDAASKIPPSLLIMCASVAVAFSL